MAQGQADLCARIGSHVCCRTVHSEPQLISCSLSSVSLVALINQKPVHFIGVRSVDDVKTLQQVKSNGIPVTVSVPFQDFAPTSATAGELFHLIDAIDMFDFGGDASKESIGHALPTLLTAVKNDKLTLDQVFQRVSAAPARIFGLTAHNETSVQIDVNWTGRAGGNAHVWIRADDDDDDLTLGVACWAHVSRDCWRRALVH